ncbi:hypothetical protein FH972_020765 [Carpinus fangiana]|uniref:F-box/LRR-repeat protein 15/At3g58940/PEG3-like LRR domain-containing protein n=1 Tax=Carpinus fangiana TaxID=176857 RepID=A0A5N6RWC9_9ROSI|nr:hypothetical protein FH972_020765 [Carpinus fangiana]
MKHKADLISGLPEAIVEHILVPLKQILQLSILSKRWQNVIWTLFPIPEIVSATLKTSILYENSSNEKRQKIRVDKEEFNYFLERTLASRNKQRASINRLKLHQICGSSDNALMNRLIGYVIESNVKELDLILRLNYYYQVPKSFVAAKAKSITELTLRKRESYLQVHVDEQILQTLIASCPVVEEITNDCYGLTSIHMSGLPKLIAFDLIYKPALESFEMEAPNLKKLILRLPKLTYKWLHGILSKCPLIESLDLDTCNMLKRIKISSDHMKSLTIYHCKRLVEVDIVVPS